MTSPDETTTDGDTPEGGEAASSLHGFLHGTVIIPPGFDLTEPAWVGEITTDCCRNEVVPASTNPAASPP